MLAFVVCEIIGLVVFIVSAVMHYWFMAKSCSSKRNGLDMYCVVLTGQWFVRSPPSTSAQLQEADKPPTHPLHPDQAAHTQQTHHHHHLLNHTHLLQDCSH